MMTRSIRWTPELIRPRANSIFPSTNYQRVARIMTHIAAGDALITRMGETITAAGETPPELRRERPDPPPDPKSGYQKYWIPVAAGVFGLVVGGIVIYAATRPDK